MTVYERYDKVFAGIIAGLVLPLLVGVLIFLFSHGDQSIHSYVVRIANSDIMTNSITLCVFPNIIIFWLFNRFDMLRATRGVLTITIVWAIVVFGTKFLL
jgi:hypothetical protein